MQTELEFLAGELQIPLPVQDEHVPFFPHPFVHIRRVLACRVLPQSAVHT
jgi:hypothetical protein